MRLDKFLADTLADLSRSRVQALLAAGHVTCNNVPITTSKHKVQAGEEFTVTLPPPEPSTLIPEAIPLTVLHEDDDLLVIDKPAGMAVHPSPGHSTGTLVHALLAHCGESLSGIGGVQRPGIVHRLDKDTSGLLLIAKHDTAHQALAEQLADRTLTRIYHAIVWGTPLPMEGVIEGNIGRSPRHRQKMAVVPRGGKEAITHYHTLQRFSALASLVECRLKTGRTHQIRVHLTHRGHGLIGDPVYGRTPTKHTLPEALHTVLSSFTRQALHAHILRFNHPTHGKVMEFSSPLPEDMADLLSCLEDLRS